MSLRQEGHTVRPNLGMCSLPTSTIAGWRAMVCRWDQLPLLPTDVFQILHGTLAHPKQLSQTMSHAGF